MTAVFAEVWRVLREDGTVWLNIGDGYAGYHGNSKKPDDLAPSNKFGYTENMRQSTANRDGLKPKDLCLVPPRLALSLQADGWWVRSAIVWAKGLSFCPTWAGSVMPESVTDRPTSAYEMVYLLTKSARYYYDSFAVRELDAEAVKPYVYGHENKRRVHEGVEGETREPGTVSGDQQKISRKQGRSGEETSIFSLGEDGTGKKEVVRDRGGESVSGSVQEVRKAESCSTPVLREWEGEGCNKKVPANSQGSGVAVSWCSQASGTNEVGSLRPDSRTMGADKESPESSLCDVREGKDSDQRSHNPDHQGGAAHNGEHSGPMPQLQQQKEQQVGRNLRNVWCIGTEPQRRIAGVDHYASYPTKLVEPCLKAGTSERGCCQVCGAPWRRVVDKGENTGQDGTSDNSATTLRNDALRHSGRIGETPRSTTGWTPTCDHGGDPVPSTVLDPFGGSGTTGLVADRLGRDAVLIELNAKYCQMAKARIEQELGMFARVTIE